jgi:hypothetical protein
LYVVYLDNKQVLQVQLSSCGDDRDVAMRVIAKCAEAFVGDENMTNVELKLLAKSLVEGRTPIEDPAAKALKRPSAAKAAPKAAPKATMAPKAAPKTTSTASSSTDALIFVPQPKASA